MFTRLGCTTVHGDVDDDEDNDDDLPLHDWRPHGCPCQGLAEPETIF